MIALALRSMAQRKLRAGADRGRDPARRRDDRRHLRPDGPDQQRLRGHRSRPRTAGVDVVVTPRRSSPAHFGAARAARRRALVERVARGRGRRRAPRASSGSRARSSSTGGGRATSRRPSSSPTCREPFNPFEPRARPPAGGARRGRRRRDSSPTTSSCGSASASASPRARASSPSRVVGVVDYGDVAVARRRDAGRRAAADMQRWFERRGRGHRRSSSPPTPASRPRQLADADAAVAAARRSRSQTGEQTAAETRGGDQRPDRRLPDPGAAGVRRRRAARRRVHHLQHVLDHGRAADARVRAAAGARRDPPPVLGAVAAEALVDRRRPPRVARALRSASASPKALGALFDAAGMGIPRGGMELAPRTIVVALPVGIGVTLLAALVPARARDARAARRRDARRRRRRPPRRRWRRVAHRARRARRPRARSPQGLFGGGPGDGRLGAMGAGTLLRLRRRRAGARYLVRPLAAASAGRSSAFAARPGELARENATRNPGRTAVTSAALMVGLGLVVFVAVFAPGSRTSFDGSIEDSSRRSSSSRATSARRCPRGAGRRASTAVAGVARRSPQYVDQIEVDGERLERHDRHPQRRRPRRASPASTRFDWLEATTSPSRGSAGDRRSIEEQFAKAHGIAVGDTFTRRRPAGGTATLTRVGGYRDPPILQGIDRRRATTFARDLRRARPVRLIIVDCATAATPAAGRGATSSGARRASRPPRCAQAPSTATAIARPARPDRLPALRAAGDEPRDLAVRDRQQPLPLDPRADARARDAARGRRDRGPGPAVIRYESVITAVIGGLLGTVVGVAFAWLSTFAARGSRRRLQRAASGSSPCSRPRRRRRHPRAVVPARRASHLNVLDAISRGE